MQDTRLVYMQVISGGHRSLMQELYQITLYGLQDIILSLDIVVSGIIGSILLVDTSMV